MCMDPRSSRGRTRLVALLAACAGVLATTLPRAHKPVTSTYTYNENVYPIFQTHCGQCHVDGGIAPMSLMRYEDAYPWAESIKEEIINLRMPPWHAAEGFGAFQRAQTLSARELDMLVEWSLGGTPEGDRANRPAPVTLDDEWPLGEPDLVVEMADVGGLPADESQGERTYRLETGLEDGRWIESVDLRPGNPAIVREATIAWLGPGDGRTLLAAWLPGRAPVEHPGGAVMLPAGAVLELQVRYRKTWTYEGLATEDRSAVGLYFSADDSPAELSRLVLASPTIDVATLPPDGRIVFGRAIEADVEAVAIRPQLQSADLEVQVELVRPDASREPMLRLERAPLDWPRRYWFEHPLAAPRGSRIEVTAHLDPDAAGSAAASADEPMIRIWVDVVEAAGPGAGR